MFGIFVFSSVPITVHFGSGSKTTTKVSPLDTTSDLLESIKDQLTSSSTQLWLIDQSGVGKRWQLVVDWESIKLIISQFISLHFCTYMYSTLYIVHVYTTTCRDVHVHVCTSWNTDYLVFKPHQRQLHVHVHVSF